MIVAGKYYRIRKYTKINGKEYYCMTIPEQFRDTFKSSDNIVKVIESGNNLIIVGSGTDNIQQI